MTFYLNSFQCSLILLSICMLLTQCLATEPPFNVTDSIKDDVVEKLHKGTPNLLLTLGDTLKDSLLHPTSDRNQGEQTLKGLYDYFYNLDDIYQMLKSKEKIENKLGMKLFRMLAEVGGPPHLDIEFDIEDAMTKFEWNNRAVFTVRKVMDETQALWDNIQIEVDKIKEQLKKIELTTIVNSP